MMEQDHLKRLGEKVRRITHVLEKRFGIPRRRRDVDLLDTLIETILSQNTGDRNRDVAYRRLRSRFPHWEDVLRAGANEVEEAIRPGGLATQKTRRIQEILGWVKRRYGRLTLVPLRKMNSEEIEKTIGSLNGIGPKTLHCLLLFGLKREAFPVDTHVLRVGKRLGFIPEKIDAQEAHRWMVPLLPKGKSLSLHLNLIRFGRSFCRAKNPQCPICFLSKECPHPPKAA